MFKIPYDHREVRYFTEEKYKGNYESIIKQRFPGGIYYKVRRYTEEDPVTKPLQDAHIDYIVLWRGRLYLIDFKGNNTKNGYADYAILEIFRQYKYLQPDGSYKSGRTIEGWVKSCNDVEVPVEILNDMPKEMRDAIPNGIIDVPESRQYIIRVSGKEFITFRKDMIREFRKRHTEMFSPGALVYEIDDEKKKGSSKIKYDFNLYFYYNDSKDVNYLEEMGAKKYQLVGATWYEVPIKKLGNLND